MENIDFICVDKLECEIAQITIQRPEAMNALNSQMVAELKSVVKQLEDDREVACIILCGKNDSFIAGADIRELNVSGVLEAYKFSAEMKALHDLIINSKKPYIAAIKGYCLGGGLELALACDIRLADQTAKLGLPEINLGIIPGGGGVQRILELAGPSIASEMVMSGEIIDAKKAKEVKIVNSVTPDVLEKAFSLARSISSKSRYAITASKKLLNQRKLKQSTMELEEELYEFSLLFAYPDAFEGMSAFIEKRKPTFQKEV